MKNRVMKNPVSDFPSKIQQRGRENTKILGKLEKLVENRGEFRGKGL